MNFDIWEQLKFDCMYYKNFGRSPYEREYSDDEIKELVELYTLSEETIKNLI